MIMRCKIFLLFFLISLNITSQIEAVKTDEGSSNNQVTDIVIVFKMHFDIGYTNLAEGVLQKYSNEMLEETLKAIDETATLPKSEQFVWTTPAWPLKYILENCTPENKIRLEKAIREQRIIPMHCQLHIIQKGVIWKPLFEAFHLPPN